MISSPSVRKLLMRKKESLPRPQLGRRLRTTPPRRSLTMQPERSKRQRTQKKRKKQRKKTLMMIKLRIRKLKKNQLRLKKIKKTNKMRKNK